MVYDSIANGSIPTAASNSKDFGKKKRVNRSAKLKQSKLDVRREQWLSQVKNKGLGTGAKEEPKMRVPDVHAVKERECEMVKLEISVGENEGGYSDSESLSNSPTSHTSSVSVANFTGSSSGCGSSSGSSGGCFSGNLTDEEDRRDHEVGDDDDDDCLDDWETMADALIADDELQKNCDTESVVREAVPEPEPELTTRAGQEGNRASGGLRAWRPDDVSRPQSLPNLLKQNSFPMKSGMHMHHGVGFAPSSCPICCEDLDMTDSSFLPCPCGYRLCLFCHKRILEDDGRCPGCRQKYEQPDQGTVPAKLARCYSMNTKLQK